MNRLSEGQIEQIRTATEDILENVGFRVMHDGLLGKARAAGAKVDGPGGIVRIPRSLLRELLGQVPCEYQVAGIDGQRHTVGGDHQHCVAIVTDPWIIDYESQQPRRPCLEDLGRHTAIAQSLDEVVAISRMDFPVTDFQGPTSSLRALEVHLLNHAKHNHVMPATLESFEQWLQIGRVLSRDGEVGKSRLMSVGMGILSPLCISDLNCELLLRACAEGLTVRPTICPMAGTTAPYSKVGTLLLANAENAFAAALTQMVRPGNPYLYSCGPSVTDMQSGNDRYYTLDKVPWKLGLVQLGNSYNMPVSTECGGAMTYRYDQQNGAEGMLFMLAAYESGTNLLSGIGSSYNAVGMSAEMMIIQAAWLEAARFLGRGIDTGLLERSVESIEKAGPRGHFLQDDLTLELLRSSEFFSNELFDYSGEYGARASLLERAHQRVEAIVAGFKSPVPDDIQEGLRRWFHDAYTKMAG